MSTGSEKVTAAELTNDKKCQDYLENAIKLKAERERMRAVATQGILAYTAVLKNDMRGIIRVSEKNVPSETYDFKPNASDHYPIRHAIDLCYYDIFLKLLELECEKDVWDSRKRTPLMHLISMKRAGSYPNTRFSRDKEKMRFDMITAMAEVGGPTTNTMLERRDKDGENCFHIACHQGYLEDIELLIELDVDVNARIVSSYQYRGTPVQREKEGDTAFISVARRKKGYQGNYMEVLEMLYYDGKADINLRGNEGMTALMWATYNEDLDLMEWLIEEGADINEQSHFGATALMHACEHLKYKAATFLLEYDKEAHELRKQKEIIAAAQEKARELEEIGEMTKKQRDKYYLQKAKEEEEQAAKMSKRQKMNAKDLLSSAPKKGKKEGKKENKEGFRAAKISAALQGKMSNKNYKYPRMLGYYREQDPMRWNWEELWEKAGADFSKPAKDPSECNANITVLNDATPLVALSRKCLSANPAQLGPLVDLMLSKGANPDLKSSDGFCPLMWAVMNDDLPLAKQLIAGKANPNAKDTLSISILDNCKSGAMRTLIKSAIEMHERRMKDGESQGGDDSSVVSGMR